MLSYCFFCYFTNVKPQLTVRYGYRYSYSSRVAPSISSAMSCHINVLVKFNGEYPRQATIFPIKWFYNTLELNTRAFYTVHITLKARVHKGKIQVVCVCVMI